MNDITTLEKMLQGKDGKKVEVQVCYDHVKFRAEKAEVIVPINLLSTFSTSLEMSRDIGKKYAEGLIKARRFAEEVNHLIEEFDKEVTKTQRRLTFYSSVLEILSDYSSKKAFKSIISGEEDYLLQVSSSYEVHITGKNGKPAALTLTDFLNLSLPEEARELLERKFVECLEASGRVLDLTTGFNSLVPIETSLGKKLAKAQESLLSNTYCRKMIKSEYD